MMPKDAVIVGMSGGVDSSVSAALLRQANPEGVLSGLFMKNWDEDDGTEWCTARRDAEDAHAVCGRLDIPFSTVNLAAEYWDEVFELFLAECRAGRTPNPDIHCNEEIKFKAFLEHAMDLGAERVATGHYARKGGEAGAWRLLKGRDSAKDQSYFLCRLSQAQLARALFPVGAMLKSEVRAHARQARLPNHGKKDSTGICFIGERPFREFLARYLPPRKGEIQDHEGRALGEHQGVWYYTLGQRQGLGIGGVRDAGEEPWYVYAKDMEANALRVVQGHDHPLLFCRAARAAQCHWINAAPRQGQRLAAKTRYRQPDQGCIVDAIDADAGTIALRFKEPQRAVTPGQSLVLYAGEECLGGGIIDGTE